MEKNTGLMEKKTAMDQLFSKITQHVIILLFFFFFYFISAPRMMHIVLIKKTKKQQKKTKKHQMFETHTQLLDEIKFENYDDLTKVSFSFSPSSLSLSPSPLPLWTKI